MTSAAYDLKEFLRSNWRRLSAKKKRRYVLAKSVGWGWLGYHAFLIGHRLSGYVPPILGLRDGILYMEWIPQPTVEPLKKREELIEASARLCGCEGSSPESKNWLSSRHRSEAVYDGIWLLEKVLSRAYGRVLTDMLMQSRLGGLMRKRPCPFPTLIDGNMHRSEWVLGPPRPLKADFEHHGMGKSSLNVNDPAYDLADTILNLGAFASGRKWPATTLYHGVRRHYRRTAPFHA